MRFFRIQCLYRDLFPEAVFRVNTSENDLYLTFDDGPTPGVTERIISILDKANVPATFFCQGSGFEASDEVSNLLQSKNFYVANHGYSHLSGWKSGKEKYIRDVNRGFDITGSPMFRPPYGHLRPSQYRDLRKRFKIIFWDLMLYDFDRTFHFEDMIIILRKKVRPGSILLLHDNVKSISPAILENLILICHDMGYNFGNLGDVTDV